MCRKKGVQATKSSQECVRDNYCKTKAQEGQSVDNYAKDGGPGEV